MKRFLELFSINHLSVGELSTRFKRLLFCNFVFVMVILLSLTVFAPKLSYLFGLLSKNRNNVETTPKSKITPPLFRDLPQATKENKLNISGSAKPGSTIVVYINGPEKGKTISGNDGIFQFQDLPLNTGKNTISGKTIDSDGTESERTSNVYVVVDKEEPKLTLESPKDGETIKNLDKRIKVKGKINEKATIKINDKFAIQKPDMSFEFLLGVEKEGEIEIKIEITDIAGNKKEETIKAKYLKQGV